MGMPTKQVRFSLTNNSHAAPPSPIGSVLSRHNSLPSSTPQFHLYTLSPAISSHSQTKLRLRSALRRSAHPLLKISDTGKRAPLEYDIRRHPTSASVHHHPLPSNVVNEPAIYPPLPCIIIVSPYISSKWNIHVHASNKSYVTVQDVLDTLHRSLRFTVSAAEYRDLPTDKSRSRVGHAYRERCNALQGHRSYEDEKKGGLKRIDFLMEYTRFVGLTPTESGHDTWVLNVHHEGS